MPAQFSDITTRYASSAISRWFIALRLRTFAKRFEQIVDQLPATGRVVDVGCGYGVFIFFAKHIRPQLVYVGIDHDAKRIAQAKQGQRSGESIFYEVADARTFTFAPGDCVVLIDVLHHIPYAAHHSLLQRIADETRGTGKLIIADVEKKLSWKYWASYLSDVIIYPRSTKCQFYTAKELSALLSDSGWAHCQQYPGSNGAFSTILYACTSPLA